MKTAFESQRPGSKFEFTGRDAAALKPLFDSQGPDKILVAWTRALGHAGFPSVAHVHELVTNFNHFSAPKVLAGGTRHQRAEAQNHQDDKPF